MENIKFIDITQLPDDLWQDAKNVIALDSNGEVIKAAKEDTYSKEEIDDLLKDAEISADKLQNKIKINSASTDYIVTQPTVSGDSLVITDSMSDKNQYHTFGYDKTITTTSNVLLNNSTPLFRGSNEYNCPQWDGNTIRFKYDSGINLNIRLTIPYTYNGVKYVTHFDIDVKSSSMYNMNFGVINDPNFASYQAVEFRESEVYKSFGANETFVFKNNNYIKDYANLGNSINYTYDFLYPNNIVEITIGNFPLTSSNGELVIETPRFYLYSNNVLMGDKITEYETSDYPERLNDYIRYSNDVKAYILTDKNTTFKTINGQQILGDGNIEISTDVDLSNLATKEELNTKQDTISDLDSIRSGAALGATALQSVPSDYALKTDILSAKTDTRYTTFDVQNPVLSGKTIILQNEVTDSRKYHTLGYDKTITAIVPVQKYINITRNYNGVPSMDTNVESGIGFDGSNINGDITFTLDKINAVTNIMHYEVSYVERDSEGNVTGAGETVIADVIYDPNTKLLSVPGTEFTFAQIRRSDKNTYLFGGGTDGTEYFENGRTYYNFEQNPLQEGATLIWMPYYSSGLYWDYSVTINGIFYQESSVTTDDKPERLNDYIRYSNNVKAYILTDKNTTFKTINGQQITGSGNIEVAANVDLSSYATKSELATKQDVITDLETIRNGAAKGSTALQAVPSGYATEQWVNEQGFLKEHQDISNLATKSELATKQDVITDLDAIRSGAAKGATALQSVPSEYALKSEIPDISTKQDKLVSGSNIKTINGNSLLGSGNIVIEASSDNVPTLQTTVEGTTNNYIYSSGRNDKYGVISDIKNLVSYEEDKASINTGWVYWGTSSVIDAAYGWSINGATTSQAGLMSASDKSKLDGIDLSTKQDTLVSGTNIKTVNGTSLLGSGNIEVSANVDLSDYYTKSQTNALVSPKLSQVTLTQAEYDALSTKKENVLYIISDATTTDSSDYYTKAEIDAMIGGASSTITEINNLVV